MPTVELEISPAEVTQLAERDLPEGTPVELDYDSSYGGEQTARGRLDKLDMDEVYGEKTAEEARRIGRAEPGDVLIGDRILRRGDVRSVRDRRRIGRPRRARVRVPLERAVDIVGRYGHYDVDRHEEGAIIQFWEGNPESDPETYWDGEVVMPFLEGGEPVNPGYQPYNSLVRERERY